MVLAMSCIGIVDATAKWLGQSLHGLQVVWGYFSAMTFTLVLVIVGQRRSPFTLLKTQRWKLQVGRAACLVGSLSCLFVALQHIPLAEATVISFTAPLFVVALAGPMLGERVHWTRWVAVLTGMAGATLVVRPGTELFQIAALLPLIGSFFFALFNIVTPKLREDPSETTLLYTCGAGALLTTIGAPWVWQWPSLNEWLIILGFGALGALAHFGVVRSFMNADVSTLAPLNYTRLIWALGLGWILFSQWPDTLALVGGAIIVASGLYVVINAARGN